MKKTEHHGMNVLFLDIETAPSLAYVWGLFKETIPLDRLVEPGYTLCWAARWEHDEKVIFRSRLDHDEPGMLEPLHALLDEADVVVHYNGKKFDVPTINGELVKHGFHPPKPYDQIDLYHVVRRQFRLVSNKLAFVAKHFGLVEKEDSPKMEDWKHCMAALDVAEGDWLTQEQVDAWAKMKSYNERDAHMLVGLYHLLMPWVPNHPNRGLYMDPNTDPVCPSCGSDDLRFKGYKHTRTMRYKQYQCNDCGSWSRARLSEKPTRKELLR